ncbi:DUF4148 domain-containing protein [Paraburkholderia ferrariae]|uniref:DUF4148 domain-containing protein n=1 Tax=Paraburkholderia ferrariae TaxID=386056 RepID=UPI000482D712|nr:DUF4148 domain-containing protein [Paraburkholderia ferrariae]
MKYLMIAIAMLGATATTSAFAQSNSANAAAQPAQVAQVGQSAQAGQWVAPYGQPVAQKTRAQVYNELIQAEQDGQLAYLNSTIYAHS